MDFLSKLLTTILKINDYEPEKLELVRLSSDGKEPDTSFYVTKFEKREWEEFMSELDSRHDDESRRVLSYRFLLRGAKVAAKPHKEHPDSPFVVLLKKPSDNIFDSNILVDVRSPSTWTSGLSKHDATAEIEAWKNGKKT